MKFFRHRPFGLVVGLIVVFLMGSFPRTTRAGSLTIVRDYLQRQVANMSSGEVHDFFFSPTTSLGGTGNTVEVRYPANQSGTWCSVAGAVTESGITQTSGASESAVALPGTVAASCTIGNNSTTGDVLIVTGVGPLTSGIEYGFRLADDVGHLGTPNAQQGIKVTLATTNGSSDVDSEFFYVSIIGNDQVVISATVVGYIPPVDTNPGVTFAGFAASNGGVVVSRDGTTVTTVTTSADSFFNIVLSDQPVGVHTFVVTGTDSSGAALAPVTFVISLTYNTTTFLNNVFLGPSIAIDQTTLKLGQSFVLSGSTAPNSLVTVSLQSNPTSVSATSNGQGAWNVSVNSTTIGTGSHTARARAITSSSVVSAFSQTINFAVNPVGSCDGKATADLNCDGRVNITDFSVLLFFWRQHNPSNTRADINADGIVDIVDFSIMLYQWTS